MKFARIIIFIQCILFSANAFGADRPKQSRNLLPVTQPFSSKSKTSSYPIISSINNNVNEYVQSPTSTIIFSEEFDGLTGFPPQGWKTVNVDGGGTTGPWFQGNNSIFYAISGDGYAAANYQGANDFYIDEWLISPQIFSISDLDTLQFWHRSPDFSPWDDSLEIRISTTDTAITSFTVRLGYIKTSTSGWLLQKYPLKNIIPSGSNIYIAFRYLLYNGGVSGLSSDYTGIDLVQIISPQVVKDIEVNSVDYPFAKSKILKNISFNPLATFRNAGIVNAEKIPIKLKITSPSGSIFENNDTIPSIPAGESYQKEFADYIPTESGLYTITAYSLMGDDQNYSNDSSQSIFRAVILISGTFTVGAGAEISTLSQAIDSINNNIVSDDVTFNLISNTYNEPPLTLGPIEYISLPAKILIKPGGDFPVLIDISSTPEKPYGIYIRGTSKVTIDGSYLTSNEQKITINSRGTSGMVGILIGGVEGAYSDSNQIKNVIVHTGADSLKSSEGYYGILLYGYNAYYRDAGNKIINCDISKHGAVGIGVQWQTGANIEKNKIHDWVQSSGSNDVHGIWLGDGSTEVKISGNSIGNIQTKVNYSWAYGIENGSGEGSNIKIINNMIYSILSSGAGNNPNISRGIYSSSTLNTNDHYYYNSIYLGGCDSSDNISSRTASIEIAGGSNLTFLNNILYNNINFSSPSTEDKSFCYYLSVLPENFKSDYNDIYAPGLQGSIGYNDGDRKTLDAWIASFPTSTDTASINANPYFIQPDAGNLHIYPNSYSPVNNAGTYIPEIVTDFDDEVRSTVSPDIGADEFIPGGRSIEITYQIGWNLLSVPLFVEDFRKSTIFPTSISSAFKFEDGYVLAETLNNGEGYWLKFNSQQQIRFVGLPLTSDTITVHAGWNIIGSVSDTVNVTDIIQIPEDIIESKFYSYNGSYSYSDFIIPGKAYWVKIKSDGVLILK
ncbi:MAG: choice-of-anchor J domain-containing protein [Ignavibacteriales bacterium]|nr:choice-of-anchor J domain-containing protein [Ignavibacteriales bacterium]